MEAELISGLATRVELICQKRGLTYNKLAKELDMSSTTFYQLTSGRTKQLSLEVLIKFHQVLGINIEWLVTGDGNMLSAGSKNGEESKHPQHQLSTLEQKLDKLLDQIAVKDRQIEGLQRTVDVLVGKSECATNDPLSYDEFSKEVMYHYYTQKVYKNLIAPAVKAHQPSAHN